jgi:hypothetical protein
LSAASAASAVQPEPGADSCLAEPNEQLVAGRPRKKGLRAATGGFLPRLKSWQDARHPITTQEKK